MGFMQPQIELITKEKGFRWRLSAPGYLDCTEWTKARTIREAILDCSALYGDGFDLDDWRILTSYDSELSDFVEAYLLAVGFTATNFDGEPIFPCQGEFSDSYDWGEVAEKIEPQELNSFIGSAVDFFCLAKNSGLVRIDEDMQAFGANFHFSRNGHGTGFWDSDHPHKSELQAMAKTFGGLELYA